MTATDGVERNVRALHRDVPLAASMETWWGSDGIAQLLKTFDIPYACINPGSSFRGLHDSLVNYSGNEKPQIVVCLHEEQAVSIAHGYAKVTGKPLLVLLHSNVGVMHASMAIFNAWCDRVPMLIVGAHGPADAAKRRPWIDWIHTSRDAGAMIRSFVKWDDQPLSLEATYKSLLRARQMTETSPKAPVYVCMDVGVQELRLDAPPYIPDVMRYPAAAAPHASAAQFDRLEALVHAATHPLLLIGRVSRDEAEWAERVRLAEVLGADVLTDLKVGAAFPTDHPLHQHAPSMFLDENAAKTIRRADLVISLEWIDLQGTLKAAWGESDIRSTVVHVSLDQAIHNAQSLDHQDLPLTDLLVAADQASVVHEMLRRLECDGRVRPLRLERDVRSRQPLSEDGCGDIDMPRLANALRAATRSQPVSLIRLPLGWSGDLWHFRHPLDYLGQDGGAGVGSGPGMAVGAAIALKDSARLPVAILGDGDFMMGNTALWTAANLQVPLLIIVANNRSFFNDEVHQERVAQERIRPLENKWIGQRIDDPPVDIAALARAQGFQAWGFVESRNELEAVLAKAIGRVREGGTCLVDVRVRPGYAPSMSAGMTKPHTTGLNAGTSV